ncbi:MAG TPA: diguanylate cyclase [Symbiobacteriaceae bacterium]|nr:diguanylate cyclase [Symbiobacteriaceae bacterium]
MNQKTPRAAAAFMKVTIAVAVLIGMWVALAAGFPLREVPAFVVLTICGGLAHLYPIRSAQTNVATYVVANTFLFTGIILLSGGWLALMPLLIWIPYTVRRYHQRKPDWLLIPAANAGQALIGSAGAHLLLGAWTHPTSLSFLDVAVLLVVMGFFVVYQTLWVAVVIHLARRVRIFSIELWKTDILLPELLIIGLGAISAILWRTHPGLMVLVLAPVVFAYHMLRGVQLIRLAEIDGKTGLYNSRRFEEQFQHELTSARVLRRPISLIFFDLDFLRDINNTYGHLAGDAVIAEVAQRIRKSLRHQDFAARFGGEEFVLLLPGTETIEAHYLAERIREAVAGCPFDIGDGLHISCSISGGVAAFPKHGDTLAQLTAAADGALYYAKRQGRNRTHTADEVPAEEWVERTAAPSGHAAAHARPTLRSVKAETAAAEVAAAQAPAAEPDDLPPAPPEPAPPVQPAGMCRPWLPDAAVMLLAAAALFLPFLMGQPLPNLVMLSIFCGLGFAAEYWRVDLLGDGERRSTVSLGVAVTMAAGATLGMYAAISVNIVNFCAFALQARGARWRTLASNLAVMIMAAVAGSWPFALIRTRSAGLDHWFAAAVGMGGALYFLVNVGVVALMVSLRQGAPLRQLWRERFAWLAPAFVFTAVSGGLMGSAFLYMGWFVVPVFAIPLLIVRREYQTHIRRSREAYETAERGRKALEAAHQLKTRSMEQLIQVVSTIIDARDASVYGHSNQVARYAQAIAVELGIPEDEVMCIRQASLLHDVGKFGVPEAILHKPTKPTHEEWNIIMEHTRIGEEILRAVPGMEKVSRIVGQHHEEFNGKGYPEGAAGDQITMGARIIALADAVDSMLSDRPYSKAKPLSWAVEEVERCSGEHFDPLVVAAFRRVVGKQPAAFFVNSAPQSERHPFRPASCVLRA